MPLPWAHREVSGEGALQIHTRNAYVPLDAAKLTPAQKAAALESIMTVKHKRDDSIKSRFCADGRKQRGHIPREETASPTVTLDSVFITSAMEAHEERDTAVVDLPGAYLSADLDSNDTVIMVLRGHLAELMALADETVYRRYVTTDARGNKFL